MASNKGGGGGDRITSLDDQDTAEAVEQQAIQVSGRTPQVQESKSLTSGLGGGLAKLCGRYATVTVWQGQDELGKVPARPSVNGYVIQIPRGEPCRIPVEHLEVLQNAVQDKYDQNGQNPTPNPRFNVQVHSIDPEQVAA